MTCVDAGEGRTCVQGLFRNDFPDRVGVIECDRGRDCGEDESCYKNPQFPGQRCDFTIAGMDGLSEPAYCSGQEDCVAYCRHDQRWVPNCHGGSCECLDRCTKDADCTNCGPLIVRRQEIDGNAVPFCDRRKAACDCRARRR